MFAGEGANEKAWREKGWVLSPYDILKDEKLMNLEPASQRIKEPPLILSRIEATAQKKLSMGNILPDTQPSGPPFYVAYGDL